MSGRGFTHRVRMLSRHHGIGVARGEKAQHREGRGEHLPWPHGAPELRQRSVVMIEFAQKRLRL
jgi:hypothetical protein